MGKIVVLGCGYVGRVLARRLIGQGKPVLATTTTVAKLPDLAALGAEVARLGPGAEDAYATVLKDADAIVHLAPPGDVDIAEETARIARACGDRLRVFLYGSTTGVFGDAGDGWIDETTPPRDPGARGRRRLDFERGLKNAGLPLRTIRIAGIYGPGRTMRTRLERGEMVLFEGGPPTSRIHVHDLVTLIEGMLEDDAPPLAVACDDAPAPTLEVARYVSELLGLNMPEPLSIEAAREVLSPAAIEMRLGGRRCRSLVRERLVGPLKYPTYREGMRASLADEGATLV